MFHKMLLPYILPIPNGVTFHDVWIAFVASSYGTITYTEEALTLYRRYTEQVTHVEKKKSNSGFFERLKEKEARKIAYAQRQQEHLQALLNLDHSILADTSILDNIQIAMEHFRYFEKRLFSATFFWKLWKERERFFAIDGTQKRRQIRAFKIALGLSAYRFTLYSL